MHAMRREPIPLLGLLLVACGSSSGPQYEITTQINPNLPSEEVAAYPVPDVPPPAVLPPLDAGTARDAPGE
jgi:hypothetical protein